MFFFLGGGDGVFFVFLHFKFFFFWEGVLLRVLGFWGLVGVFVFFVREGGLMKFHLCCVFFNNSFVVLQERRYSQVVYSSPQLRNSCSTDSCFRLSSEVWCFCTAHSLCPIQMSVWFARALFFFTFSVKGCLTRLVGDSAFVAWLKPLSSRLICIVDFSHISICERFCIDRSGCRYQRLGVGTVQSIVSTKLPSSTLAVSAHRHIHGVAG